MLSLAGCVFFPALPGKVTLRERLAAFPLSQPPIEAPVKIYFDDYQIPYVETENDDDLFFVMGAVHAHLRLAQMEVMRRISQGRLSEMAGPVTTGIDYGLRILNLGKAAESILAAMPAESRRFLERFAEGINFYTAGMEELPHDFRILGIEREAWSARDVVVLARLYTVEVNWLLLSQILSFGEDPALKEVLERLLEKGGSPVTAQTLTMGGVLESSAKSGSNSFVISPRLSRTGGALMVNDPHVGFSIPNLWMIAGFESPGINSVGLFFPGFPLPVMGRNRRISWGGTNGWVLTSSIYDAGELDVTSREEIIKRRWLPDKKVTIRETKLGPIITDAPLFEDYDGRPLVLKWVGHEISDEFTAFLRVNRAENFDEFRQAFESYAVSGQNFTFADVEGHIGKVLAARVPVGALDNPRELVKDPGDPGSQWRGFLTTMDLPFTYDPDLGFIASANERPEETKQPLVLFSSPRDRYERLTELLGGKNNFGVQDAAEIQMDVFSSTAVRVRDHFLRHMKGRELTSPFSEALRDWDGRYDTGSRGACAFELLQAEFMERYYPRRYGRKIGAFFLKSFLSGGFLEKDLEVAEDKGELRRKSMEEAFDAAEKSFDPRLVWGDIHTMELRHFLSRIPLLGWRYRLDSFPVAGSSLTVMKTAHQVSAEPHTATFGATARHISDLSGMDENFFVLLGGEDGRLGSSNLLDQVDFWRSGKLIKTPLRNETAASRAAATVRMRPGADSRVEFSFDVR